MTDASLPAPDDDGAAKRGAVYVGSGVLTIALGIVTLFIDGLEVLPWMLIPGGALWIIIGLSQRRAAGPPRPRERSRRDDGGATPVIGSDTGSGTGRGGRADDHASDPGDGGGFGGDGGGD